MQGKVHTDAMSPVYVGIDVCKARLDVYLHPAGERFSERVAVRRVGDEASPLEVVEECGIDGHVVPFSGRSQMVFPGPGAGCPGSKGSRRYPLELTTGVRDEI